MGRRHRYCRWSRCDGEGGDVHLRDRVVTCHSFEEDVIILCVWEECG